MSVPMNSMPYRGFRPVYGGNAVYSGQGGAFAYSPSEASTGLFPSTDSYSTQSSGMKFEEASSSYSSSDMTTDPGQPSQSITDTGPPQSPVHDVADVESTDPVKPNQRLKDFFKGMGQGFRHLFSLPGLLTLAAATVIGALLPWTVPFMVLLGLGVALFQIIGGMVSDDWQQAGRGAFSLLSSLVLGSLLSELFPIGGRDGLRFALPGRSPHPLQFRDVCGDPFINVNRWYAINPTPEYVLTGTSYNVPWYIFGVQNTGATVSTAGTSIAGSTSGLTGVTSGASAIAAEAPIATPSEMMLASASVRDSSLNQTSIEVAALASDKSTHSDSPSSQNSTALSQAYDSAVESDMSSSSFSDSDNSGDSGSDSSA